MASGPITSGQINLEKVQAMTSFIFLGSKITADGDSRLEITRRLLLGRKVMTNLDSIFKSRDINLPTTVRLVKAMVFPVVRYGCESESHSVVSDSLQPHGLYSPWNSPGQNTGVGSLSLLRRSSFA